MPVPPNLHPSSLMIEEPEQQVIYAPVREHSRKPDEQYRRIEQMYPGKCYLEMFARRTWPGWSVWGNQVESDVILSVGVDNAKMQPA